MEVRCNNTNISLIPCHTHTSLLAKVQHWQFSKPLRLANFQTTKCSVAVNLLTEGQLHQTDSMSDNSDKVILLPFLSPLSADDLFLCYSHFIFCYSSLPIQGAVVSHWIIWITNHSFYLWKLSCSFKSTCRDTDINAYTAYRERFLFPPLWKQG